MKNDLMKQLLVVGIAVVLVSIIFIPIVTSYNNRLEKQVEIVKEEDDGYSVFPDVDRYRISYDITENQLGYYLPQIKPYSLWPHRTFRDKLKVRMSQSIQDDDARKKAVTRELKLEGLKDDGNYTPHDPIWIDGDGEFTVENGVVGGNGTADDPYIIEGWEIISSSDPAAIVVINTRSHFIVTHCLFEAPYGVLTYNITFGTFDNIIYNGGTMGNWAYIESSSNVTLCNSTVYALWGLGAFFSEYFSVINCNISCSSEYEGVGFYIQTSSFGVLSNVTVQGFEVGVQVEFNSSHTTIRDCDVYSNMVGIALLDSPFQVLRNNCLYDNSYNLDIWGRKMDEYYHDIDMSNTIDGKPVYYLYNASDLIFDETMEIGFLGLINCNNITVKNYTTINSGVGLLLVGTRASTITSCTIKNSFSSAILLFGSRKVTISDCYVDDAGIALVDSPNNILRNNTIDNSYNAFYVYGDKLEDFYQDIDQSNTINGKTMYYLVGKKNQVFKESEVGFLALVDCKNMIVTNVKVSGAAQGILLVQTRALIRKCEFFFNTDAVYIVNKSLVWVYDSKIYNNIWGFNFYHASDAAVVRCNVSGNWDGFNFDNSHDIIIRGCSISNHAFNGFQIWDSWNNVICGNTISENSWGGINMINNFWGNEICGNNINNGYTGIIMRPGYMESDQLIAPNNNNIHHNDIHHMQYVGINSDDANGNLIHHNNIHDTDPGIELSRCQGYEINQNNIFDNNVGLKAYDSTVDAANNWWGSEDGPNGIGPGSGDSIISYNSDITFEPWLKEPATIKFFNFLIFLACLRARLRSLIG